MSVQNDEPLRFIVEGSTSDGEPNHTAVARNVDNTLSAMPPTSAPDSSVQDEIAHSPMMTSREELLLRLEEEIILHELALQALASRKKALAANLGEARSNREGHAGKLQFWQKQRGKLQDAQAKQFDLLREMRQALEKSEERLARISETSNKNAVSHDNDEESIVRTQPFDPPSIELPERGSSPAALMMNEDVQVCTTKSPLPTTNTQLIVTGRIPRLHWDHDIMAGFWKTQGYASKGQLTFLPCIDSKSLIQRIMDVTALETLTLDRTFPDGNHRLESLWKTCLDLASVATPSTRDMKGLPTSFMTNDLKPNTAIDPNVALCPYELAGVCADAYCLYQHLTPRPSMPVIPLERLPLPLVRLPSGPTEALSAKSDTVLTQVSIDEPVRKRPRLADTEADAVDIDSTNDDNRYLAHDITNQEAFDDTYDAQTTDKVTMEWNDDYISLPMVADHVEDDESDGEDTESQSVDSESDSRAPATLDGSDSSYPSYWWMTGYDIERLRSFGPPRTVLCLSVTDWLTAFGGFTFNETGDSQSIHPSVFSPGVTGDTGETLLLISFKCDKQVPKTQEDSIRFVARCNDCLRLSIHAGRFDIGRGLLNLTKDFFAEMPSSTCKELMLKVICFMDSICRSTFNHNSSENDFLCAFNAQLCLAIIHEFLRLVYIKQAWTPRWASDLGMALFPLLPVASRTKERKVSYKRTIRVAHSKVDREQISTSEKGRDFTRLKSDEPMPEGKDESNHDDTSEYETWQQLHSFHDFLVEHQKNMELMGVVEVGESLGDFLKSTLDFLRHRLHALGESEHDIFAILQTVVQVGYVIFGSADSISRHVVANGAVNSSLSATLADIDASINQLVTLLTRYISHVPLMDVILAPLYALSTSISSTLRRYGNAQHRIENALNAASVRTTANTKNEGGFMYYSELLWSQFIQLRASFPNVSNTEAFDLRNPTLPDHILKDHEALASCITRFGVSLNHLTLCGDWNLIHPRQPPDTAAAYDLISLVFPSNSTRMDSSGLCESHGDEQLSTAKDVTEFTLKNVPLQVTNLKQRSPTALSLGFPRSLFLRGQSLLSLTVQDCHLEELPVTFGIHFSHLKVEDFTVNISLFRCSPVCLLYCRGSVGDISHVLSWCVGKTSLETQNISQVLDVSYNGLRTIPLTIGCMRSLEALNVSHNRMLSLPTAALGELRSLRELNVSHNRLSELPDTIVDCLALESLNVSHNQITSIPDDLPLRLKWLREFAFTGNPVSKNSLMG